MSCSFDEKNITPIKKKIQDITNNYNDEMKNISIKPVSEQIPLLNNLKVAKKYVDGVDGVEYLNEVFSEISDTSVKVDKCVQSYKGIVENKGIKIEDKSTSIIMYSDTIKTNKINLFKTFQMIIGIILISFFLYLNKEKPL